MVNLNEKDARSWAETYYECVSHIERLRVLKTDETLPRIIRETQEQQGSVGMYDLAIEWANEFEAQYKGEKWGEDYFEYFDVIEMWLKAKCENEKGYTVTDPNTNQRYKYMGNGYFHWIEDRIINPHTKATVEFEKTIRLEDYSVFEVTDTAKAFGYDEEEMEAKRDSADLDDTVFLLEMLFEFSN